MYHSECDKIGDSAYADQEKLLKQGEMHWHTVGDASESAILKFCEVCDSFFSF